MKKTKTYKQLEKEFNTAVHKLQKECKHIKQTEWTDEYWAMGHSTGRKVKCCKFCNKKVATDNSVMENWRRQQIDDNPIRWRKYSDEEKKYWIKKGYCKVPSKKEK